jgi:hypothetical protein
MKSINKAKRIFWWMVAFYILENVIFGFNWTAQSTAEKVCDSIVQIGMFIALLTYLEPLYKMYHEKVRERDEIESLLKQAEETGNSKHEQ